MHNLLFLFNKQIVLDLIISVELLNFMFISIGFILIGFILIEFQNFHLCLSIISDVTLTNSKLLPSPSVIFSVYVYFYSFVFDFFFCFYSLFFFIFLYFSFIFPLFFLYFSFIFPLLFHCLFSQNKFSNFIL